MTRSAVHAPLPVEADARPRGRLPVAFGPRALGMLLIGFAWLVPAFIDPTEKSPTRLAALFGNLENVWKLLLAGPPPPPLPKLPVAPVTVLPGTPVSRPGR